RFNGKGNDYDDAQSVAVSPDGGTVFVTGYSDSGAVGSDMATVAYDAATGAVRWIRRYNGPAGTGDGAYAVAVSPDGSRVFVTGFTDDPEGYYATFATVGYDAVAGTTLWASVYSNKGR